MRPGTALAALAAVRTGSAAPTGDGGTGLRSLGVQGLAVVQVPPELEKEGRDLNMHASQLQQSFSRTPGAAGDALSYLRAIDTLLAEGQEFNHNWQAWLSTKGYPFNAVAEQTATIERELQPPGCAEKLLHEGHVVALGTKLKHD